ncbi:MAG: sulfotransferase family 2 domain-containing protein [Cyanobacteria bacterium P01_F01_bin.150]
MSSPIATEHTAAYESLQPDEALIFLHIMKTGGTSLFKVMLQQYSKDLTFHYVPMKKGKRLEDFQRWPQEKRDRLQFFHGHGCYGAHQWLTQPSRYITMLRQPVKRVLSLYYFIHHNPKRDVPAEGPCPTLKSYLDAQVLAIDNGQTRAIAGKAAADFAFGECTSELLDIAKQNLSHFLAVGTTERFDESLLVFKHVLKLNNVLYARTNENGRKPTIDEMASEDIARIKALNQLDEALYDYANQLLDERISQIGETFPIELQFFQSVNRQYSDVKLELKSTKKQLRDKHQRLLSIRQQYNQLKNQEIPEPFSIREKVTNKVKGLGRRLIGRES